MTNGIGGFILVVSSHRFHLGGKKLNPKSWPATWDLGFLPTCLQKKKKKKKNSAGFHTSLTLGSSRLSFTSFLLRSPDRQSTSHASVRTMILRIRLHVRRCRDWPQQTAGRARARIPTKLPNYRPWVLATPPPPALGTLKAAPRRASPRLEESRVSIRIS